MIEYKCKALPKSDKLIVRESLNPGRVIVETHSTRGQQGNAYLSPEQAAHLGNALLDWALRRGARPVEVDIIGTSIGGTSIGGC